MRFGIFVSLLAHLALAGLALFSLPEGWRPDLQVEPYVPIELIAEAELAKKTSVPAAQIEPIEDILPEPAPEPEPEPIIEELAPAPEPVIEEKIPEPEPEPAPVKLEPELPKETPKIRPKKAENNDLDLDALSALVDKSKDDSPQSKAPRETASDAVNVAQRDRAAIGAGDRLTASDYAKLQAAMFKCWTPPVGAPDAEKLKVLIEIRLSRDGTLDGQPRVLNSTAIALSGNQFWKTAEQAALRAVISCQPYDFLSQDRYESWHELEMNFDMSAMVGR